MRTSLVLAVALTSVAAAGCLGGDDSSSDLELQQGALCAPTKLATTLAVSSGTPKQAAKNAIDGNTGTRWESAYSDPQWLYVDLGAVKKITEVRIDWQHAGAKDYRIDVSNDAVTWSAAVVTKTGLTAIDHRIDDLTGFSVSARYVRVFGTARATVYGYSIWELTVYDGSSCGTGTGGAGGGTAGSGGSGGKAGAGGSAGTGTGGAAGTGGTAGTGTGGACTNVSLTTSTTLVTTASSGTPSRAFDNNTGTRWESAFSDPQWITVDLGAVKTISEVRIDWQHAGAKDYRIDVSSDGVTWSAPLVTKTAMPPIDHRIDDLTGLHGIGRFVRMYGTARATQYGYSIWEMDVFGDSNTSCGGSTNLLTAGWVRSDLAANFTPLPAVSFPAGKNAFSLDYTGKTFTVTSAPPLLELAQQVTIPQAGTQWRLTFTISGINDQANAPPRFLAALAGVQPGTYAPTVASVPGNGQLVRVGSLTSGSQLTADFSNLPFAAGDVVDVVIDNVPIFGTSPAGQGKQKFDVTDVSLVRLN